MSEGSEAVNRRLNRDGWLEVGYTTAGGQVFSAPIGTPAPSGFITKDSGKREVRPSGYVRDTQEGKPRFDLLFPKGVPFDEQFMTRVAELLARGAEKYNERNWEKANDQESLDRFKASALRHLIQWITGDVEEDHAAAVVFNLLAHETTVQKVNP